LLKKSEWEALSPQKELELIKEGYLFVKWTDGKSPSGPLNSRLLNLTNNDSNTIRTASIGQQAQFLLTKDGAPQYAVINGYMVDLNKEASVVPNTFGY